MALTDSNNLKQLSQLACDRDWTLNDSTWSAQAWMSSTDLRIIEVALSKLAAEKGAPLQCFEWGSGRSSLHLSKRVKQDHALSSWISVEYDREWFNTFRGEVKLGPDHYVYYMDPSLRPSLPEGGTHFLVYDYGQLLPMLRKGVAHRPIKMADYVNSIGLFPDKFDFVFVDGRKRNQCLYAASQKLGNPGLVFLHDAWRPYYALGGTFFRTALRAGENLMVASHQSLSDLLKFVDITDLCSDAQVCWYMT